MALFSNSPSKKNDEIKTQAIPPEILASVRVMADEMKSGAPRASRPVPVPANLPLASSPSSPSPFLSTPARPQVEASSPAGTPVNPAAQPTAPNQGIPPASTLPKMTTRNRAVTPSPADSGKPLNSASAGKKWVLYLILGITLVLVLAGAGYYYWQSGKDQGEINAPGALPPPGGMPVPGVAPAPGAVSEPPALKTLPYALDKPNYLSLDTETVEISGIKKDIDEVVARLIEGSVGEPIEFILTDKNNNPIAFNRFAYLSGLPLSQDLLAEIEESFSLYLSAENGRGVIGLRLLLKDAAKGSALITQREAALPKQFAPLLYSGTNIVIPATVTFTPSPERADVRIVRYHNFSLDPNVSFDYTVADKQWFIGTSKETFRRMLEKTE